MDSPDAWMGALLEMDGRPGALVAEDGHILRRGSRFEATFGALASVDDLLDVLVWFGPRGASLWSVEGQGLPLRFEQLPGIEPPHFLVSVADREDRNEDPYRIAATTAGFGHWRYDVETGRLTYSEEVRRLFALDPARPLKAEQAFDLLPARSREGVRRQARRSLETGEPLDVEVELTDRRGGSRWARVTGRPEWRRGQLVALQGGVHDVTDAHRARLRESELHLRLQLATRAVGIGIFEWTSGRLGLDPEGCRLHGLSAGAGPFRLEDTRILAEDRAMLERELEAEDGAKVIQGRYRIRAADGCLRWIEYTGRIARGAEQDRPRAIGVVRDVTEVQESERRARESEAHLRLVERSVAAVFWIADFEDVRLTYVSPAAEEIWGVPVDALLRPDGLECLRGRIPEAEREQIWQALRSAVNERKRHWRVQHRFVRSSGEVRWVDHTGSVVERPDGGPPRLVGVTVDVTAQRRLEEDLIRASKMEVLGRIAGGIAHDFNNLLAVIAGYANLGVLDESTPEAQESFQHIIDAAQQAAGLTRRLLLLGRPQPLDIRPVSLPRSFGELKALLGRVFGPEVRWQIEVEPQLPEVAADPAQLEQVLINLAVNGRDAMHGRGVLRLGAKRARALDGRAGVELFVQDSGEGIPPALRERVFEPFFTTKPEGKGTGLGLPTARTVLERCGGTIFVDGEFEEGARFVMWLPEAPEAVSAEALPVQTRIPDVDPSARVVVVDDDERVCFFLERSLERSGFCPRAYRDAQSFLDAIDLTSLEVDAVVSDVRMPGMGGFELVEELRRRRPDLPILLMSAYVDEAETELPSGVGFLSKPFTQADLLLRVRDLLH